MAGLAEFKPDGGNMKSHYSQIFADMVWVSSMLAINSLRRGKIVNKIVVYRLLVDYKTGLGLVVKYYVDLDLDQTMLFIGDEINAVKGFIGIMRVLRSVHVGNCI